MNKCSYNFTRFQKNYEYSLKKLNIKKHIKHGRKKESI